MEITRFRLKFLRAFSLIELLVVVSIFTLISLVILANHSKFNSSVLLGSLAYDMALSIRQAQVYGLSVEQYNSSSFNVGYGVHFSTGTTYLFFQDVNSNKIYDPGGVTPDPIIKTYSLGTGHSMKSICGTLVGGVQHCSPSMTSLDIIFLRPDPDANMSSNLPGEVYSSGQIQVTSPSGETRTVNIASTGQVSVTNP